jgi:hypothetical protein
MSAPTTKEKEKEDKIIKELEFHAKLLNLTLNCATCRPEVRKLIEEGEYTS